MKIWEECRTSCIRTRKVTATYHNFVVLYYPGRRRHRPYTEVRWHWRNSVSVPKLAENIKQEVRSCKVDFRKSVQPRHGEQSCHSPQEAGVSCNKIKGKHSLLQTSAKGACVDGGKRHFRTLLFPFFRAQSLTMSKFLQHCSVSHYGIKEVMNKLVHFHRLQRVMLWTNWRQLAIGRGSARPIPNIHTGKEHPCRHVTERVTRLTRNIKS